MTRFIRQATLTLALLLVASAASAQRVAAPARGNPAADPALAKHYLLTDLTGRWRHTSPGMGVMNLTLNPNGTYTFSQAKDGKTKNLSGEYAFSDGASGRSDLVLFSGPRAPKKTPVVRWSFTKGSSTAIMTLRNRIFQRVG
jgi:hypothetical protein